MTVFLTHVFINAPFSYSSKKATYTLTTDASLRLGKTQLKFTLMPMLGVTTILSTLLR